MLFSIHLRIHKQANESVQQNDSRFFKFQGPPQPMREARLQRYAPQMDVLSRWWRSRRPVKRCITRHFMRLRLGPRLTMLHLRSATMDRLPFDEFVTLRMLRRVHQTF
jgi:hypothetical protein